MVLELDDGELGVGRGTELEALRGTQRAVAAGEAERRQRKARRRRGSSGVIVSGGGGAGSKGVEGRCRWNGTDMASAGALTAVPLRRVVLI